MTVINRVYLLEEAVCYRCDTIRGIVQSFPFISIAFHLTQSIRFAEGIGRKGSKGDHGGSPMSVIGIVRKSRRGLGTIFVFRLTEERKPVRTPQLRHVARRAGLLVLAVFLLACSAGLAYVVVLTHQTAPLRGESPSLLPLIVMACGSAFAGLVVLRLAVHRDDDEFAISSFDR
jgi:hypothetical protein